MVPESISRNKKQETTLRDPLDAGAEVINAYGISTSAEEPRLQTRFIMQYMRVCFRRFALHAFLAGSAKVSATVGCEKESLGIAILGGRFRFYTLACPCVKFLASFAASSPGRRLDAVVVSRTPFSFSRLCFLRSRKCRRLSNGLVFRMV